MSDYQGEESVPKGNEWEVVALTDSTYAASPSPKESISDSSIVGAENTETARAMFMSGHFGSPSKQENMPQEGDRTIPLRMLEHSGTLDSKKEEDINMEGFVSDGGKNFVGKGETISFHSSDFGDVVPLNLIEKEQSTYEYGKSGSFHAEANTSLRDDSGITEPVESLDRSDTSETSDMPKHYKEDEFSNFSCEAWWRKHAVSLYAHTKNVNPVWSIVVVAAVVGLVIVGYRRQQDKQQIMQLKPRLTLDDEGSRWILGPFTRFKDAMLGGRNNSYIGVLSVAEH